ncbi:hypothetical protein LTR56_023204 [Elasticomyces elasticus]|nr:hypothetical protein LTR22_027176 [Elasticomyces elasticus]KAK3620792.1 hypothetical protein LTR56_023204 [Elasticomyces elasticus]KAK4900757.1 hypothetical protein LTR49_027377 [Elasticomyces elasticus]KAK5732771.1 hypothetical protein LTS12_027061 [Elasticomyces elasticus]
MSANSTTEPGRLLTITSDDHGPSLWVAIICCFCFLTIAQLVRILYRAKSDFGLGADDYVVVGSYVVAVIQYVLLMVSLAHGLGKSEALITGENRAIVANCFYASEILLIIALFAAKYSIFLLVQQLFASLTKGMVVMLVIPSLAALLGLVSVVVVAIPCWPLQDFEKGGSKCTQRSSRWIVLTAADIATEVIIIALPTFLIWRRTQMNLRNKLKTTGLFATSRIVVVAVSILFIYFKLRRSSSDAAKPGVALALPTIIQQAGLAVAIITATMIPCISLFGVVEKTQGIPGSYDSGLNPMANVKVTTSITLRSVKRRSEDLHSNESDTIGLVDMSPSVQRAAGPTLRPDATQRVFVRSGDN